MRTHLQKRLREIDDTGGPAKRLDAMARTARNLLGTNRAIDLEAIAAHLREMEPVLTRAEADTEILDKMTVAVDSVRRGSEHAWTIVLAIEPGESFRDCLAGAIARYVDGVVPTLRLPEESAG